MSDVQAQSEDWRVREAIATIDHLVAKLATAEEQGALAILSAVGLTVERDELRERLSAVRAELAAAERERDDLADALAHARKHAARVHGCTGGMDGEINPA